MYGQESKSLSTNGLSRVCKTTVQEGGYSLLQWISQKYPYHSSEEWNRLIQKAQVRVNGQIVSPDFPLVTGMEISYYPDPIEEPPVASTWSILKEYPGEWVVINKPPDLPCHPGGRYFQHTLWAFLKNQYAEFYFVNRLDRETSGVVLVALNSRQARKLGKKIANGSLKKEYLVLVEGNFPQEYLAKGWLVPDANSMIRKKRRFIELKGNFDIEGQSASEACETYFMLLASDGGISLLRAVPITGKTHQIRATLQSLGFPVVGDKLYGLNSEYFLRFIESRLTEDDQERLRMPHQALHAWELAWMDGEDHYRYRAPLPQSWYQFLSKSQFNGILQWIASNLNNSL